MSEPVTASNEATGAPLPPVDIVTILSFASVAPEVWRSLTEARRQEYIRAYWQRAAEQGVADHVA
jgi:hypothetical protein